MDESAVIVKEISKVYKIFRNNRERLLGALHPYKQYHKEFWALKNISFEIPKGKTYGLVGKNGSGKSTLLQIIAGVLNPTAGEVSLRGNVSALLELGAGFNPQFTGRDNVILNGVVNGLKRHEIEEKLPQIIEFSELGDFVDQPVRTYSSGMYVRLAFSSAIHIDPEILIIDEALAVGDARFQRKCYRKFEQFKDEGKTIILVTHDSNAVVRHCDMAILLNEGQLFEIGEPRHIINHYIKLLSSFEHIVSPESEEKASDSNTFAHIGGKPEPTEADSPLERFLKEKHLDDRCPQRQSYNDKEFRFGNQNAQIVDYLIITQNQVDPAIFEIHDSLEIYVKIIFNQKVDFPIYGLTIKRKDGIDVYGSNSWFEKIEVKPPLPGEMVIFKTALTLSLIQGDYFIGIGVVNQELDKDIVMDRRYDLIHFEVQQASRQFGIVDLQADFELL